MPSTAVSFKHAPAALLAAILAILCLFSPPVFAVSAHSTIDLMFLYTPELARQYGGESGLHARLNNLVAIINQRYINSGVETVTFRTVNTSIVDYSTVDIRAARDELTNGVGAFSNIPSLRKQYGADLVLLALPTVQGGTQCSLSSLVVSLRSTYDTSAFSIFEVGLDKVNNTYCADDLDVDGILLTNLGVGNLNNITRAVNQINSSRDAVASLMPTAVPLNESATPPIPGPLPLLGPAVAFSASYAKGSAILNWSSPGLDPETVTCSATTSDGWYGLVPVSGSQAVKPVIDTTYTLSCRSYSNLSMNFTDFSAIETKTVTAVTVAVSQMIQSENECLFDWAERSYPGLFPPAGRESGVSGIYTYRHYPSADAYVGVSSADGHVYYLGPDHRLQDEGPLSKWLPLAGCQ